MSVKRKDLVEYLEANGFRLLRKEAIQVTLEGLQAVGQPLPGGTSDEKSVEVRRVKVAV